MKSETKQCQNCQRQFEIDASDFLFYEKIKVPSPTWCWECRAIRRLAFRNMRFLYERTCAATGKKIFSLLPPDALMPVYSYEYWASDAWDPTSYGKEYDFSKPFFQQMKDLFNSVPWSEMWSIGKINSDYSVVAWAKNCYLCFDSGYDEDSAYSVTLQRSKQCFDTINCKNCELCYYSINLNDSYKTFFSRDCAACNDIWLSQDCIGCHNCFGCSGLRNKSYYIFNKPYSKEDYHARLEEMRLHSWSGIQRMRDHAFSVWLTFPVKYRHSVLANDCTGDYIYNAARLRNCFFTGTAEDLKHCQSVIYGPNTDGMDITASEGTEFSYDTIACGSGVYKTFFSHESSAIHESQYVINCRQSGNLFGCVALKEKEYCILNKQYSKEEYHRLLPKVIQHMNEVPYVDSKGRVYKYGEFFPPDLSMVGYSQSQAHEYFPLTEKEAEGQGFRWRTPEKRTYAVTKTAKDLPNHIEEVGDEIFKEAIRCLHDENKKHLKQCYTDCATAFRITSQELKFYREMKLPLPQLCFNCRNFDRVSWRNPLRLWYRKCTCTGGKSENCVYQNQAKHFHGSGRCPNEFETSYSPERPEIVYCEACYNEEVV